jgi:glutathione S-transferase
VSKVQSKPICLSEQTFVHAQEAAAARFDDEITWLMAHMSRKGPLALSDQLSLVDCAVAPHLIRLYILRHYADYR